MQWFKYSLICFIILSIAPVNAAKFTSQDCMKSRFSAQIKHEGKFFGLLKNHLSINKDKCKMDIIFRGILETVWKIDICREPIHVKVTSKGSQNVYKRKKACADDNKSDYCYFRNELMENIQDHGLIFAEGERELLKDTHGQTYCASLLLKKYLDDGYVFSSHEAPVNIYEAQESCDLPKKETKMIEEIKDPSIELKSETIIPVKLPVEEASDKPRF
jgi:hypothetical protein